MHRVKVVTGGLLLACLFFWTSCSPDTDSADDSSAGSPLADLLGYAPSADFLERSEAGLAAANQREMLRQEDIRSCMAAQGFEYIPVEPGQGDGFIAFDEIEVGSTEWVERYGFGVSTLWYEQTGLPADLVGYEYATAEGAPNPNDVLVEGMSEAERSAYDDALYGQDKEAQEANAESVGEVGAELNDDDLGCHGAAKGDVYEVLVEDFAQELADLEIALAGDIRLVEADGRIAECVRGEGYDFVNRETAIVEFEQKMSALDAEQEGSGPVNSGQLGRNQEDVLWQIQAEERAVAKAFLECGGESSDYRQLRAEVRSEYEAEFVQKHRTALQAFEA